MNDDLETRLRSLTAHLPEPEATATGSARRAMHAALDGSRGARPRLALLSRIRRGRARSYVLAFAVALVVAAGALAARGWTPADLPPFGDGPREAFVLPATDILPGGYERTRPPRYAEIPERPSLLFPAGVTHAEAVHRYAAARARGEVLPPGATLAEPLPAGKVVLIEDGRVSLDPASPIGYSAATGLVNVLWQPQPGSAEPLARCQLLVGRDDPASPSCDAPGRERAYVREGVGGRWIPSPNQEEWMPGLVEASTELSVLARPARPGDRPPARMLMPRPGHPLPEPDEARRLLVEPGIRLFAVPEGEEGVCLIAAETDERGGFTCGARSTLASMGAMLVTGSAPEPRFRVSGLVGDGVDLVRAPDGTTTRVRDNGFSFIVPKDTRSLVMSGPVGTFEVTFRGRILARGPDRPDRSRLRELVGIDLAGGGEASIRVAPNRGGGECRWVSIRGATRSFGCTRPGDEPLQYDMVTAGFNAGGPGYPFVYEGRLAPQVGAIEMTFVDGARQRVPLVEGNVLFEVPPDRTTPDRWPVAVTTFDRAGVPLVRDELEEFPAIARQQQPSP